LRVRFCDEFDHGFGWIVEGDPRRRTAHALAAGGGVWLVDPVASGAAEARLESLGEPRGVVQLLDRHKRDCASMAQRLGVPHVTLPAGRVASSPFGAISVLQRRGWREVALWWEEERVLVVGDALGTLDYFRAPDDRIGVHPFLRLTPPRGLARFEPRRILCGHGEGIHEDAARALREALATSRRRLPGAVYAAFVKLVRPR
jgi:glyoxylase-like metal-dependent hydrolase (beta-lactamase superfamily II)